MKIVLGLFVNFEMYWDERRGDDPLYFVGSKPPLPDRSFLYSGAGQKFDEKRKALWMDRKCGYA
ncbi:hypothetical protein J2TS4_08580 [Paenibacillus sp. J2TS4]|nr:hypothetical protein J2TS4_08580 [Paenibacillus sp. J2TS4]